LRCATEWLKAQTGFEEWLPMVAFGANGGVHPALGVLRPAFSPMATRAAKLEMGLEAMEAAAELLDASMPLVHDWATEGSVSTVLLLLGSFLETCARLPQSAPHTTYLAEGIALGDALGVLLTVIHIAFAHRVPLLCGSNQLRSDLLSAAAKLLVLVGPGSSLDVDCEGGLLGRGLDIWDALAAAQRESGPTTGLEEALALAFGHLLAALPQALLLPSSLAAVPDEWDMPRLRSRMSQLLTSWCDGSSARTDAMLGVVAQVSSQLLLLSSRQSPQASDWAQAELALVLSAAAAEALAGLGEDYDSSQLPSQLAQLCTALPQLPLTAAPAPWAGLLEAAAAELVRALDIWITPSRCSPTSAEGRTLLAFSFRLAASQHASSSSVDALTVVISNLAQPLTSAGEAADEAFRRLQELCLGGGGLPVHLRERLVRGAVGPLLSQLPEQQLNPAIEAFASTLRAMLPPACNVATWTLDKVAAARLLFHLLAAPQVSNCEVQLQWLSNHWPWLEAAVASPGSHEQAVDGACFLLTAVLSQARTATVVPEVLRRTVPLLAGAAAGRGSASALSALASLARMFRGGGTDETLAELFAVHAVGTARQLLDGGEERTAQLPADLLAALLELFTIALGPRCKLMARQLHRAPEVLAAILAPVVATLPSCTSPRVVCWTLLLCDRLPQWLASEDFGQQAATLLDAATPGIAAAACRLLASSPVAQDQEVAGALSKTLLGLSHARPAATRQALLSAAASLSLPQEEAELLWKQLGDPLASEDALAESLREIAESWQVEHMRQALRS